jgi:glycosyltransferase involved in cell wall biosynthesis
MMRNITVITPVAPGHHRQCVHEAIESAQQFPLHVIVLDGPGGGIDPGYNGHLHVVETERAVGRSSARNVGLQIARSYQSEWSLFLDADDLLLPTAFEDLQAAPEADLYYAEHQLEEAMAEGETIPRQSWNHLDISDDASARRMLLEQSPKLCKSILPNVSMMVRTERALRCTFDADMSQGEHFDFFIRYIANPRVKVHMMKRPLVLVRSRLSSARFGPWSDSAIERYKEWQALPI